MHVCRCFTRPTRPIETHSMHLTAASRKRNTRKPERYASSFPVYLACCALPLSSNTMDAGVAATGTVMIPLKTVTPRVPAHRYCCAPCWTWWTMVQGRGTGHMRLNPAGSSSKRNSKSANTFFSYRSLACSPHIPHPGMSRA